jgi:hypothetical protein
MSLQIFLEGKILGVDDCLLAPTSQDPDQVFTGRSHWISLLSEVLPRALLAELGLAKILIGSSGASQFLLVLPEESRGPAEAFLSAAAKEISAIGATCGGAWMRSSTATGTRPRPKQVRRYSRHPCPYRIPRSMSTFMASSAFLCAMPGASAGRRKRPAAF